MDLKNVRFGCIGAGNMAEALVRGVLGAGLLAPGQIFACDPSAPRRELFASLGVQVAEQGDTAAGCEIVLLAVKPQVLDTVVAALAPHISEKTLLVSIAAGVRISRICKLVPAGVRVVRVMPNTPMLVGRGVSAFARGDGVSDNDAKMVRMLLEAAGIVREVDEDLIDAVTAVSGSGPAYVFRFAEALAQAGQAVGLSPEMAQEFAKFTVCGAAELMLRSDQSPAQLRKNVTSPGGTTEAALKTFTTLGFDGVVEAGVKAARDRGRELSGA